MVLVWQWLTCIVDIDSTDQYQVIKLWNGLAIKQFSICYCTQKSSLPIKQRKEMISLQRSSPNIKTVTYKFSNIIPTHGFEMMHLFINNHKYFFKNIKVGIHKEIDGKDNNIVNKMVFESFRIIASYFKDIQSCHIRISESI
ncbi:hypothetical protein ACF0H5_019577 [Mactra antiquata]